MKIRIFILILAAFFLFTGSSPWEGAAAVAPAGELPATGFFAATNSFPLNTVVDITNIESGKSTRVIVAKTLNSPGLLAIISREAADLIGMRAGSVSRIRMIQPSDPMAYMRFTESMAVGTPVFESGNVITDENLEQKLLNEHYSSDSYVPPSVAKPVSPSLPAIPVEIAERGYVVDEPEWGGNGRLNIIDVPEYNINPLPAFQDIPPVTKVEEPVIKEEPVPAQPKKEPVYIAEPEEEIIYTEEPKKEPVIVTEPKPEPESEIDTYIYETPWDSYLSEDTEPDDYIYETPRDSYLSEDTEPDDYIYETPRDSYLSEGPEPDDYIYETPWESYLSEGPEPDDYIYETPWESYVSEGTEPDDYIYETPWESYVSEGPEPDDYIYETPWESYLSEGTEQAETTEKTPAQIAEQPKEQVQSKPVPEPVPLDFVPADPRPPEPSVYNIPFSDIIPGIAEIPEEKPPAVTPPVVRDSAFSVRTITQLDSGRYYVQLGAMTGDTVENVVRQIDKRYDPVVFRDRDNLYRILIGPLNQGESAAVLQRFKSIGYTDAFVRRGN